MGEEPELYVADFSQSPGAAEFRQRVERDRRRARRRYHDHLEAVFDARGVAEPGELADAALDALTVKCDLDSGEPCRCACHPQLPDTDLHDYGFDCTCTHTREERRRASQKWLNGIKAFWESPEGQAIKAAEQVADAELHAWLLGQTGVTVDSHGGVVPEVWSGHVDGHSFYFHERHDQWRIELDLRPSGRYVKTLDGTDDHGAVRYHERELDEGEVIAFGTTDVAGYGTRPVERAQFITDTIRTHLARQSCTLHHGDISVIEALLGSAIGWCPVCGTRLLPTP